MSVWVRADTVGETGRRLPVCTRSRGDLEALLRGADPERPVRTSTTLASKGAWGQGHVDRSGAGG